MEDHGEFQKSREKARRELAAGANPQGCQGRRSFLISALSPVSAGSGPAIEVVHGPPMPSDSLTATAGGGLLALLAQGNSEVGQRAARPIPERRPASPFASDKHLLGSRLPGRANS